MLTADLIPLVSIGQNVGATIVEINRKGLGASLVVDHDLVLRGIVTDGDIRRSLLEWRDIVGLPVERVMTTSPETIDEEKRAVEAVALMEHNGITVLPVVDKEKRVTGIIHLHGLLGGREFTFDGN